MFFYLDFAAQLAGFAYPRQAFAQSLLPEELSLPSITPFQESLESQNDLLQLRPEDSQEELAKTLEKQWRDWLVYADSFPEARQRGQVKTAMIPLWLASGADHYAWQSARAIESPAWQSHAIALIALWQLQNGQRELAFNTISAANLALDSQGDSDNADWRLAYQAVQDFNLASEDIDALLERASQFGADQPVQQIIRLYALRSTLPKNRDLLDELIASARPAANQRALMAETSFADRIAYAWTLFQDPEQRELLPSFFEQIIVDSARVSGQSNRDRILFDIMRVALETGQSQSVGFAIRRIESPQIRVQALASAGRGLHERGAGNISDALFALAEDIVRSPEGGFASDDARNLAAEWLVVEYTQAGKLLAAYKLAQSLDTRQARDNALSLMGVVLADHGNLRAAERLVDYIQFANPRGRVFVAIAQKSPNHEVDFWLERALQSTRLAPGSAGLHFRLMGEILDTHFTFGDSTPPDQILARIERLAVPDPVILVGEAQGPPVSAFQRLQGEIHLALARAKHDSNFAETLRPQIENWMANLWLYIDQPESVELQIRLIDSLIDMRDGLTEALTRTVALGEATGETIGAHQQRLIEKIANAAIDQNQYELALKALQSVEKS